MSELIARRTFLKGLGTAMALPVLEAMLPLSALASTGSSVAKPVRMAYMFVPNGMSMPQWTPAAEGALELSPLLQPLNSVRNSVNVLTNLAQVNAFALGDGPGDHARSTAVWLTGVHPKKTAGADIANGISADQVAAQKIGHLTKFASLEIGCERGATAGNCDSGYSCAYSSNISWRSASTPNAKEVNPRLIFERLFGNGNSAEKAQKDFFRQSILDAVIEDAAKLKGRLGARDQFKLDEYFSSVREIEVRLAKFEKENAMLAIAAGSKPEGIPSNYGEHIRLMGDMMILAFQTDLTRVCTFMFANDGSNRSYRDIGVSDGHHEVSHHGRDAKKLESKLKIDAYHIEQLAYILNKMQNTKDVDGSSLLDNSMVVYGAGISDGDRHNHDELPVLMAGKGGGSIKTGRHIILPKKTPMNNLFLTMLDKVGVNVETLGDSTGKLQGIF